MLTFMAFCVAFISAAYVEYVGIVCMFAKVLNLILFYKQNPVYAIVYAVLCLRKCDFDFRWSFFVKRNSILLILPMIW